MGQLPAEIVGDILSRMADARDVVLASMTCREWRRAFRDHLRALSFNENGWVGLRGLSGSQMEALMSRTILQTTSLQSLIVICDRQVVLSVPAVISWLLHTRKSLREFIFDVGSALNVVEICGCKKLEQLTLADAVIEGVDPNYHRFSSLRSLSLKRPVERFSNTDLTALLSVCPNLESLELTCLDLYVTFGKLKVVAPPSLRTFFLRDTDLESLTFESDSVEHLHLINAHLECFEFIGKGTLTHLTIADSFAPDLEICDSAASLESVDIVNSKIAPQFELYRLILRSSKLRMLRLWKVFHEDWSSAKGLETVSAYFERAAIRCPQLSHLTLGCDLLRGDKLFAFPLGGCTRLENMVYLKLGMSCFLKEENVWDVFSDLVEALLDRCPRLKQLVFYGLDDLIAGPRLSTPVISRVRSKCADSYVQLDLYKSW